VPTTTEPTTRRRARPGLETRAALAACAAVAAAWLIVLAAAGPEPAGWVGLGLLIGLAVFLSLQHMLVFRPLRQRLRVVRDEPAGDPAGEHDRPAPDDDLVALLESILLSPSEPRSSLRHDLDELEAKNRQLVEVADIGRELNAALPYRETVERAMARIKSFLRADFVALLIRTPDGGFELQGSLGVRSRSLDAHCCSEREDCPLREAVSGERIVRSTGHRCSLFPHTMSHQLCLPAPAEGVGQMVLLATSTTGEHLDKVTDDALDSLREDVRSALATARKYDSIRRQVVTDHLTRLYNRRHFLHRAQEEVQRSLREQAPMSLVMVDIDHFKRFNDTYGHATGDRVLQAVATQLRDAVRTTDVCARYGGEEFTLLLPTTPGDNAVFMAERVRRTLADIRYTGLGLPQDASITISCGVATCPRDATAVDELLELADQALYRAKHDGRDCVRQYEPESRP